jgi:hypothetical protein
MVNYSVVNSHIIILLVKKIFVEVLMPPFYQLKACQSESLVLQDQLWRYNFVPQLECQTGEEVHRSLDWWA